jgi:hypothetical protein
MDTSGPSVDLGGLLRGQDVEPLLASDAFLAELVVRLRARANKTIAKRGDDGR